MTEQQRSFGGIFLTEGVPFPPAGGPDRLRYLEENGLKALEVSSVEYDAAMDVLGPRASAIPQMSEPLVEPDDSARRAIQREKRLEWVEFSSALDSAVLDALRPHVTLAESSAVEALNFLEDHRLAETAHESIHRCAFIRSGLFGCPITFSDGQFWTQCLVQTSHIRMGLSAGFTGDDDCSICGRPLADCDHILGATYDVVASRDTGGNCGLCGSVSCEHIPGVSYPTVAYGIIRKAELEEVSLVPRPRFPLARLNKITIDLPGGLPADSRVVEAATRGILNCDVCLGPCKGFGGYPSPMLTQP